MRPFNSIRDDEDRPDWLQEHSAWIRQHAGRASRVDSGFVDLCPIRQRFEPPVPPTAFQEYERLQAKDRQLERLLWISGIIGGLALGWLAWFVEGRL